MEFLLELPDRTDQIGHEPELEPEEISDPLELALALHDMRQHIDSLVRTGNNNHIIQNNGRTLYVSEDLAPVVAQEGFIKDFAIRVWEAIKRFFRSLKNIFVKTKTTIRAFFKDRTSVIHELIDELETINKTLAEKGSRLSVALRNGFDLMTYKASQGDKSAKPITLEGFLLKKHDEHSLAHIVPSEANSYLTKFLFFSSELVTYLQDTESSNKIFIKEFEERKAQINNRTSATNFEFSLQIPMGLTIVTDTENPIAYSRFTDTFSPDSWFGTVTVGKDVGTRVFGDFLAEVNDDTVMSFFKTMTDIAKVSINIDRIVDSVEKADREAQYLIKQYDTANRENKTTPTSDSEYKTNLLNRSASLRHHVQKCLTVLTRYLFFLDKFIDQGKSYINMFNILIEAYEASRA